MLVSQLNDPIIDVLLISLHHRDVLINIFSHLIGSKVLIFFQLGILLSLKLLHLVLFGQLCEVNLKVVIGSINHLIVLVDIFCFLLNTSDGLREFVKADVQVSHHDWKKGCDWLLHDQQENYQSKCKQEYHNMSLTESCSTEIATRAWDFNLISLIWSQDIGVWVKHISENEMENSCPRKNVDNCSAVSFGELVCNSEISKHQELVNPVCEEKTEESNQIKDWKSTWVSHGNKDHAVKLCEPKLENELRTRVYVLILLLCDLSRLPFVKCAPPIPAPENAHLNLVNN